LAEPARDKVDEENHMRHEPDRIQSVSEIECAEGRVPSACRRAASVGLAKLLARPAAPSGERQQQRDGAKPEPGLRQPGAQQ
jgi:hypothetical protein